MSYNYEDIIYITNNGVATIIINRPEKYNAFRSKTCEEMIDAFKKAGSDKNIGVVILTGAGNKAFCTGGDQSVHSGNYDGSGRIGLPLEDLQSVIRNIPKPVIAKVRGYAIGGGNILALICDLTIASESAIFGQVGPKVGSVDPGFGTIYMSRVVGEKKAREIWYLCRQYSSFEALDMGLINKVVPDEDLDFEVNKWCIEILEKSPTALELAKLSFNTDTAHISGISSLGLKSVGLFYDTPESKEGVDAFLNKRTPNFR